MTALQNSSSELKRTRRCDESKFFPGKWKSFRVAEYIRKYLEKKAVCESICPRALVSCTSCDCVNILSHAHIQQTQKGLCARALGSRQGFFFNNRFIEVDIFGPAASSNHGRLTR